MADIIVAGNTSGAITISAPLVAGSGVLTLPTGTDTLVGKATTDTLTNKTLTSPTITGATITVAATAAPAFSAYLSANQATSSNVWTKVIFDTEEFDTNSNFASGRFTPTVAGYYQIIGQTNGGASASSFTRSISHLFNNGVGYKFGTDSAVTGSNGGSGVSSIVYLNGSTDYVEIYAFITATSPSIIGTTTAYFNGAMVRSA